MCFVLCALRVVDDFGWVEDAVRWWDSCGPLGMSTGAGSLVCAAFSHTWKSVLSLELIALVFREWESVLIFGYTPRKPLSSVYFTTLKSLVSVLRRQGSSRSLYIDCCFANRMTERQTVLLLTDLMLLLYVLLVFALCFPYFLFCTSDLSPSFPILLILLFLIFLIIKKNEKQRNK